MTPEMLAVLLPMLGFSIVLNVFLAAMLLVRPVARLAAKHLFRPLARRMGHYITTSWLGLQLMIRN